MDFAENSMGLIFWAAILLANAMLVSLPFYLIAGPCWYWGRKKVRFFSWEYATCIYAILFWWFLMLFDQSGKGYGNFFDEPLPVGVLAGVSQLIRTVFPGHTKSQRKISAYVCLTLALAGAFCVWKFIDVRPGGASLLEW